MQVKVGILAVAVVALVGLSSGEDAAQACDVDLTTKGLPICEQHCAEWCWATVIGTFQEFYRVKNLPGATPVCRGYECKVVSATTGHDCCKDQNPDGCQTGKKPCGEPATYDTLLRMMNKMIPSEKFVIIPGAPPERQLQQLLMAGHPVGRITDGHINAVVGCRPGKEGNVEYRLVDSLSPPDQPMWENYAIWVEPIPGYKWLNSTYSVGETTVV